MDLCGVDGPHLISGVDLFLSNTNLETQIKNDMFVNATEWVNIYSTQKWHNYIILS